MYGDETAQLRRPCCVLFGNNSSGQIVGAPKADAVKQPTVLPNLFFTSVAFGDSHGVGLTESLDTYVWGEGHLGLGEGTTQVLDQPRRVPTLDGISVRQVACGGDFTLCNAGSDLLSFGANDVGSLGLGTGSPLETFKPRPIPLFRSLALPVVHVACGYDFALAVTFTGQVYSWGNNSQGQLGRGRHVTDSSSPQLIEGLWGVHVVQAAAGEAHGMVLTAAGSVYSFGRRKQGQLGWASSPASGTSGEESLRAAVAELEAEFAPENKAPVVVRWAGTLSQMGFNRRQAENAIALSGSRSLEDAIEYALAHPAPQPSTSGRGAGPSSTPPSSAPQEPGDGGSDGPRLKRVAGLPRIVAIAAGGDHSAAIDCSGNLYTWGRGGAGQLGHGSLEDQAAPRRVTAGSMGGDASPRVRSVACGALHTIALTTEGVVLGAGSNESGQLAHLLGASRINELVPLDLPLPPGMAVTDAFAGGHCTALSLRPAGDHAAVSAPPFQTAVDRLRELIAKASSAASSGDSSYESKAVRERALKDVVAMIDLVFSNPSCIVSTLLPSSRARVVSSAAPREPPALSVDTASLSDLYRSLLELYDASVVQALLKALTAFIKDINENAGLLQTFERSLCLLPLVQCPLLSEPRYASLLIPPLGEAVRRMPARAKAHVARWISTFPKEILGAYCVRPLLNHIKLEVENGRVGRSMFLAVYTLELMYRASVYGGNVLGIEEFYSDVLSDLINTNDQLLVTTYQVWRQKYAHPAALRVPPECVQGDDPNFTLAEYPFLLSPKAKSRLLRVESELNMAQYVNASRHEHLQQMLSSAGGLFGVFGPGSGPSLRDPLEGDRVAPRGKSRASVAAPPSASASPSPSASGSRPGSFRVHQAASSSQRPSHPGLDGLMRFVYGLGGPVAEALVGGAIDVGAQFLHEFTGANGGAAASGGGAGGGGPNASHELPPPDACGVPPTHQDFCVLRIRRPNLLEDALEEIARQRPRDLHKPLRVHMIGEEAVDAGGVKKEFFQLLIQGLLDPRYSLFVYNQETRTCWFNPHSLESDVEFQLAGIAVGLAIYNSVLLDFPLPLALYKKILGHPVGLPDLALMQPTLGRSLAQLLAYQGEHGSVEDVFCQSFAVDVEVFGEVRSVPLKPGGEEEAVTEANRGEYVGLYVDFVLNKSVARQYEAFERGFLMCCGGPVLRLIAPSELEQLVCGVPFLDFRELRKNARYEGGYSESSQEVQWLWQILDDYTLEDRKKFLKFFSGSDRAPIGGLGQLKLTVQRAGPDSDRLPSASTCFNILLLPAYSSRSKMRHFLQVAIENAEGFGLQ